MISVGAGVLQTIHDLNATAVRHAPYGSVGNVPVRPSPVSRIPRRTSGSVSTNTLPFLPFAFALNFYAKSALFYFSFFTLHSLSSSSCFRETLPVCAPPLFAFDRRSSVVLEDSALRLELLCLSVPVNNPRFRDSTADILLQCGISVHSV
nr:hypothetical protein Iba_chr12cCG19580 [Ipomoea batatas]